MSRLTAAVCCFGLSGLFAWISAYAFSAELNARAHATEAGAMLIMKLPVQMGIVGGFALLASILMLVIGIGCLIASMVPRKPQSTKES